MINIKPPSDNSADATTRRGFLFGLFGGLIGALGLAGARRIPGGSDSPSPAPAPAGPIDNIFVPIRRKTQPQEKR